MDDIEAQATVLLLKLYARHDPNVTFHINDILGTEDEPDWVDEVAAHLKHERLTEQVGGGGTRLRLTPMGQAHARTLLRDRANPANRARVLRTRMLQYLYTSHGTRVINWSEFLASERAVFLGDRLGEVEVKREASYLVGRWLIQDRGSAQSGPGMLRPEITDAGRTCVEDYDGDVSGYLAAQNSRGGTTVNNTNIHNTSGNVAFNNTNSNVHQAVTNEMDFSALQKFAQTFAQALPSLEGLSSDDEALVRETAAEISTEIAKPQPSVGKLQQFYDMLWTTFLKAAPSPLTNIVTELATTAADSFHHVPGH